MSMCRTRYDAYSMNVVVIVFIKFLRRHAGRIRPHAQIVTVIAGASQSEIGFWQNFLRIPRGETANICWSVQLSYL